MTPRHTLTLLCTDPTCDGWHGIDGLYTGDTWDSPGDTVPEECPTCNGPLVARSEARIDPVTATDALLTALDEHGLLATNDLDEAALLAVIVTEVRRQAKTAKARALAKSLNTCSRCNGRGEIVARSTSVGGGCVNDDWDVCPGCRGSGRVALGRTA